MSDIVWGFPFNYDDIVHESINKVAEGIDFKGNKCRVYQIVIFERINEEPQALGIQVSDGVRADDVFGGV